MNPQNKTVNNPLHSPHGILLVNKPKGKTSFSLVAMLRKKLNVKKIGHAGTLDPFATGVMVMLIGKEYTRLSDSFLMQDKEYVAQLKLGITTDSYDCEGQIIAESDNQPTLESIQEAIKHFQGEIEQLPPMFSAKKIDGKRLYTLARQGVTVERKTVKVTLETEVLEYAYPFLTIKVKCTKGTYIRSIAHDLGIMLGCGAHLSALERTRSGKYTIQECLDGDQLYIHDTDILPWIKK